MMPLEPEIIEWMNSVVQFAPFLRENEHSEPVYGPVDSYAAFIDYRQRQIRDVGGNQVTSMSKVSMNPTNESGTATLIAPSVRSQLTLPANPSYPAGQIVQVLSIAYISDPDDGSMHHYIFYC